VVDYRHVIHSLRIEKEGESEALKGEVNGLRSIGREEARFFAGGEKGVSVSLRRGEKKEIADARKKNDLDALFLRGGKRGKEVRVDFLGKRSTFPSWGGGKKKTDPCYASPESERGERKP